MTEARDHLLDDELGYEVPAEPDEADPADLGDTDSANRMLRRLRATEREAAEITEIAALDVAQTLAWRDKRLDSLASTARWCHRSLEGWIRAVHARTGQQSVKLPAGTVQLRKSQPRLEVDSSVAIDEELAEYWRELARDAEVTEEPVIVKRSLAKRVIGAILTPGPVIGPADPDGYEPHEAVGPAGEVVAGVTIHVPTVLGYSAKPAKSIEDLDADL